MRVGTSGSDAEVATVDEANIIDAEVWVDRHGVQESLRVPALETEQSCLLRWGVASIEELSGKALIECLQEGGSSCPELHGDSVHRHWDERGVRRRSTELSKAQGRLAVEEGTQERRTDGGTWRCVGSVGIQ
jgi:hypothetical protein